MDHCLNPLQQPRRTHRGRGFNNEAFFALWAESGGSPGGVGSQWTKLFRGARRPSGWEEAGGYKEERRREKTERSKREANPLLLRSWQCWTTFWPLLSFLLVRSYFTQIAWLWLAKWLAHDFFFVFKWIMSFIAFLWRTHPMITTVFVVPDKFYQPFMAGVHNYEHVSSKKTSPISLTIINTGKSNWMTHFISLQSTNPLNY